MADTQDEPMLPTNTEEITLNSLADRLDILGNQMNWLCENLQSVFVFVQQMGQSGGGWRGMLQSFRNGQQEVVNE